MPLNLNAQELLAYLVYRHGALCTVREIAAAIFEEDDNTTKQSDYLRKVISALKQGLQKHGAADVIKKSYNSIGIVSELVDCDYYGINDKENDSISFFNGEFMAQYAWAEEMAGYLMGLAEKNNKRTAFNV